MTKQPRTGGRPMPPQHLLDCLLTSFKPAPEVKQWVQEQILSEAGRIHNPEHGHLVDADVQYLWASEGFGRQGRQVIGQAEMVSFQVSGWKRARQEQQLREWFGHEPAFIITLDASYASRCSDTDWCALVEHELFHIAQRKNAFGAPEFTKDGRPKLFIQGHDVEEFVGVVKRYGVGDPNGALARIAAAARGQPEVTRSSIAGACGTCLVRTA